MYNTDPQCIIKIVQGITFQEHQKTFLNITVDVLPFLEQGAKKRNCIIPVSNSSCIYFSHLLAIHWNTNLHTIFAETVNVLTRQVTKGSKMMPLFGDKTIRLYIEPLLVSFRSFPQIFCGGVNSKHFKTQKFELQEEYNVTARTKSRQYGNS